MHWKLFIRHHHQCMDWAHIPSQCLDVSVLFKQNIRMLESFSWFHTRKKKKNKNKRKKSRNNGTLFSPITNGYVCFDFFLSCFMHFVTNDIRFSFGRSILFYYARVVWNVVQFVLYINFFSLIHKDFLIQVILSVCLCVSMSLNYSIVIDEYNETSEKEKKWIHSCIL